MKKIRYKQIEEQRLEEEGAAIAEAVASNVLLGEDFDDAYNIVLKKDNGLESGGCYINFDPIESDTLAFIPCHGLLEYSLEELGWVSDVDEPSFMWSNGETIDSIVSSDILGEDLEPQSFGEEGQDTVAANGVSSPQTDEALQMDSPLFSHMLDCASKIDLPEECDGNQPLGPFVENNSNQMKKKAEDELQREENNMQKQVCKPQQSSHEDGRKRSLHSSKASHTHGNATNHLRSSEAKQIYHQKKIGEEFRAYFQKLLSSNNLAPPSELEELISPVITTEENEMLCSIPTAKEIKDVVKKMDSRISPGPDGKSCFIYKAHWDTLGEALIETVRHFFSTGHLSEEMNATYLIVVSKNNNPVELETFRPITVCNIAYKVISKIMANRLQPLLDKIIAPLQSTFVRGRSLSDYALIVSKLVNYMSQKKGKRGFMALKLKMADAYHLIEWPFLLEVIKKHGFSEKWLLLVNQCISTTSLSVVIKGATYGHIRPQRGLRQGDPLSPALFVITTDVLSRLIIREENNQNFHGTKVSRTSPRISHLIHCDTLHIFCHADLLDAKCLLNCLDKYHQWSGQSISFDKSAVFFSKNVILEDAKQLKETLSVSNCCSKAKHFGVLSPKSTPNNEAFDEVAIKLGARLTSWKSRSLPNMGADTGLYNDDKAWVRNSERNGCCKD